jgi:murein DD-endopeptidase MepM/ murein hydrolase activator NlpD
MLAVSVLACVSRPIPSVPAAAGVPQLVDAPRPSLERLRAAPPSPPVDGISVDALGAATWVRTPGGWRWPVDGVVTSAWGPRWGRLHEGVDIGAPTGTPVRAPRGGVVVAAGSEGSLGLRVVLDHGGGWTSRYGHLSELAVRVGDVLVDDQVLGAVGATGNATGPHLHWEIREDGVVRDPALLEVEAARAAREGA